jgi:hypothetical protein
MARLKSCPLAHLRQWELFSERWVGLGGRIYSTTEVVPLRTSTLEQLGSVLKLDT